ncbi:PREDICTED: uncharacterized protein LOC104585898 isoform X3 [Nelumbo nucifera]|uniref:Uncharacterized protein LOC104585898 isoform X3 n=1 Tax=Nelumbo nucifera TaxID=4432 RepID=A0A1U7YQP4_NELNU|nr:PREDICTED: uncharacterized protein LOC104585898 isoform X3 [Nelumbo nucifera]
MKLAHRQMASSQKGKEIAPSQADDEKGKCYDVARWSVRDKRVFITLMHEEFKGNRPTTTFNKVGWNVIRKQFRKKTGNDYLGTQFRNKFNKLRLVYREFRSYLSTLGLDITGSLVRDAYIRTSGPPEGKAISHC